MRRCRAEIGTGYRCSAPLSRSLDICHSCEARVVGMMNRMLERYGQYELALELRHHYQRTHRQGITCPECFGNAWEKNYGKPLTPQMSYVTV